MLKIYFKSTCSTCKNALALIKENTDEDYELVEYMVETPSQKEIKEILKMLGLKAIDLVRRSLFTKRSTMVKNSLIPNG